MVDVVHCCTEFTQKLHFFAMKFCKYLQLKDSKQPGRKLGNLGKL